MSLLVWSIFGPACSGQITGKITLDGPVPLVAPWPVIIVPPGGFPNGLPPMPRGPLPDPAWRVGPNNELEDVLVRLEAADPARLRGNVPPKPIEVTIMNGVFDQRIVGVMVGQDLKFTNADPAIEGVYGIPVLNQAVCFDLRQHKTEAIKLNAIETFEVHRIDHKRIVLLICCLPHPYFAVSGPDGCFAINVVPPDGEYSIIAWHRTGKKQEKTVTVKNAKATIDFAIKPPDPPAHQKARKPAPTTQGK